MTHPREVDRTPSTMAPSARHAGRASPTRVIRLLGWLATVLLLAFAILSPGAALATKPDPDHKVDICHRTNSVTNPYVMIDVDVASADGDLGNNHGQGDHYAEHLGPVFNPQSPPPPPHNGDQWGDIIPPIAGVHSGLNWSTGQAWWLNGCNAPPTTTTTTTTTTPTTTTTTTTPTTTTTTTTTGTTTVVTTTVVTTATGTVQALTASPTPAGAVQALTASPKHTLPVTATDGIETSATVNLRPLLILGASLLAGLLLFLPSDRVAARRRR